MKNVGASNAPSGILAMMLEIALSTVIDHELGYVRIIATMDRLVFTAM